MDVPIITMDQGEAVEKREEYRAAVKADEYPNTPEGKRARALDAAAAEGFKAIAAGKRVINVATALSVGGQFTEGRHRGLPRLAIARADATFVRFDVYGSTGSPRYSYTAGFDASAGWRKQNRELVFPDLVWNEPLAREAYGRRHRWQAIVPTIPPAVRPKWARLFSHFILWEADWERAPVDPFLLRHLAGDLYTVEAEWDLTELERSLLDHALLQR